MNNNHLSNVSFDSLDLHAQIKAGICDAGFNFCTPIQAEALPITIDQKDVAGQAQTGTGKTAAFLIATFQRLLISNQKNTKNNKSQPMGFILAPTRELAIQIAKDADTLGKYTEIKIGLAYGGKDYEKQRKNIEKGIDVLIGTPGRIIDYYKQGVFKLNKVQVLVLDEADRMFDLGFIKDIRYLLRRLPSPNKRLNMLFSATLSHKVLELAYEHMNEPALIRIEPEKITASGVRQAIFFPSNEEKIKLLIGLIKEIGSKKIMVFSNTKREVQRLETYLLANNIDAKAISGDVPQNKRISMLTSFKEGKLSVLICTDVASRGLHIPDVQCIINYDLPQDSEDYVHRIGRTARAGNSGDAISFGCETYAVSLPDIEKYIGYKIPVADYNPTDLPQIKKPKFKKNIASKKRKVRK
tara:strand:- start:557 stop:1792 length:1236 start_codon:yes stop_codon:yes gene_type:complete